MPEHIKIRQAPGTYVVRAGGAVLGESKAALELTEGDYPPVIYFPREDLAMAFLDKTATTSTCPFKGEATHYAIQTKSVLIEDAGLSYETPKKGMERISGYLAFHPQKAAVEML